MDGPARAAGDGALLPRGVVQHENIVRLPLRELVREGKAPVPADVGRHDGGVTESGAENLWARAGDLDDVARPQPLYSAVNRVHFRVLKLARAAVAHAAVPGFRGLLSIAATVRVADIAPT